MRPLLKAIQLIINISFQWPHLNLPYISQCAMKRTDKVGVQKPPSFYRNLPILEVINIAKTGYIFSQSVKCIYMFPIFSMLKAVTRSPNTFWSACSCNIFAVLLQEQAFDMHIWCDTCTFLMHSVNAEIWPKIWLVSNCVVLWMEHKSCTEK